MKFEQEQGITETDSAKTKQKDTKNVKKYI